MNHGCDDPTCATCAATARRHDLVRSAMTVDDRLDDIKRAQIWTRIDRAIDTSPRRFRAFGVVAIGACAAAAVACWLVLGRAPDAVVLVAPGDSTLTAHVGPHTSAQLIGPARLEIEGPPGDATRVRLREGALVAEFTGGPGRSLHIDAPSAAIDIVGTLFAVEVTRDGTCVSVAHGKVAVTAAATKLAVSTGESWCSARAQIETLSPALRERFDRFAAISVASAVPAPATVASAVPAATASVPPVVDPSRPIASSVEPPNAEPPHVEPWRAEPARVEPPRVEPPRAEPPRAEPSRTEPTRVEPPRVAKLDTNATSAQHSPAEQSSAQPSLATSSAAGPSAVSTGAAATDAAATDSAATSAAATSAAATTAMPSSAAATSAAATSAARSTDSAAHVEATRTEPARVDAPPVDSPRASPAAPASVRHAPAPRTAETLYQRAEAALGKHDLAAADRSLAALVTDFADSPLVEEAIYERARIAYQRHAWSDARRQLERLAQDRASPLAEPGAYLACRIDVETHDEAAVRCLSDYRKTYPSSPHDLDVVGLLVDLAYRDGGCARAAPAIDELARSHPRAPLVKAWRARCEVPK